MASRSVFALLAAFVLALPLLASAHTTGASWSIPYKEYTVDVGYDPTTFVAGQYTRFDFLLWKGPANTGTPAEYAQVWVRITRAGNDTVLATGIWKQPIGPTTLLFEFENPGSYTLQASYRDEDGNDIAVASIPITVASGSSAVNFAGFGVPLLALVIGLGIGAFVMRARMR